MGRCFVNCTFSWMKMLEGLVMTSVTSFIFYAGLLSRLEEMHLGGFPPEKMLKNWEGTRP